jgi:hypothetical protein
MVVTAGVLVMTASAVPATASGPVEPSLMARGLASHDDWYPSEESGCRPGIAVCVDNLIREMERTYDRLGCDHNAVFSLLYLRTTEGIGAAIADGTFDDPHLLAHQAYVFGRYYLDPLRAWQQGRDEAVPEAWRIAFEAGEQRTVSVSGDMMLGINAHVNRDLPFVLAAIGLVTPEGESRKPDHDRVNDVLAGTRPVAVPQIAAELDPSILDVPPSDGNPVPIWREAAWQNAQRLIDAPDAEARAAVAAEIEQTSAAIARHFVDLFAYDDGDPELEARTAHCAAARG